jgi:UDP-glucose 4-epimerase
MNILVTGGAGFIGSNLANELSKNNNVFVLDDLSSGKKQNLQKNITFVKGSVTDCSFVEKATKNIDYVFHLAALISVQESIRNPIKTIEINSLGTLNVLKASLKNNIKKVIFSSSAAVYGDSEDLPKKETMLPNPLSPYSITKLEGEYYCNVYTQLGLPTCCLRYFNVFGPNQNLNSDYSAAIPIFINKALKNEDLVLYNSGKQTRDFIFVKDVVLANILAMNKLDGFFNVGSGEESSIKKIAETIVRLTDSKSKTINAPKKQGDVERSVSDISKISSFGWKPRYELANGLKETISYFKNK